MTRTCPTYAARPDTGTLLQLFPFTTALDAAASANPLSGWPWCADDTFFPPHKNALFPHNRFLYPRFLNEDGRIREKRLSKLHYRFRRYSTLTKKVLLESQYLQSYGSHFDFLWPKFEEVRHNFADIEIQAKLFSQS